MKLFKVFANVVRYDDCISCTIITGSEERAIDSYPGLESNIYKVKEFDMCS